MTVQELPTAVSISRKECIVGLEYLLREAKAGVIVSVHGVAIKGDNCYETFNSYTPNGHTAAGMLMQVAMDLLHKELL